MAQWENKEETELKVPGGSLPLCVNNCGLPANPTTNNMCQACFKASLPTLRPSDPIRIPRSDPIRQPESPERPDPAAEAPLEASPAARVVNRCAGCRKKVGLTGFRCRCGELFCATHRYSDRHRCGFDYKAAGRDSIARENPVCKAAKIVRF